MKAPRTWLTMSTLLALPAAALISAQAAKADVATDTYAAENGPRVCRVLDAFPSFAGIEGIADAIVQQDGFTYFQAGEIEAASVMTFCPRHLPLMQRFIDAYAGPAASAGIGGLHAA